jgi:hypothetical protein
MPKDYEVNMWSATIEAIVLPQQTLTSNEDQESSSFEGDVHDHENIDHEID